MSNWTNQGWEMNNIKDFPPGTYGFIYRIKLLYEGKDPKYYIGKKALYHTIKRPWSKKASKAWREQNPRGRMPNKQVIKKESDWLTYKGSHPTLLEHDGPVVKEIMEYTSSKRHLTYLEESYLFKFKAIEDPKFLNNNIGGRFYRGNLK